MKTLILGGTGFIGYHASLECIKRGHEVTVLALPPLPKSGLLPPQVRIELANVDTMPDDELRELLTGHDAIIHAAGADDRTVPKAPAYDFFFKANVLPAQRIFKLSREAGIKRGVLISSYFCHFDRVWPEHKLSHHHPYIRTRREQSQRALESAAPDLELMVLELPFVFGSMPGREPLWKPLISYLRSPIPLFCPEGGTNMIAVEHASQAIVGALESGVGGQSYVVGDENRSWKSLVETLCEIMELDKKVRMLPTSLVQKAMKVIAFWHYIQGKEAGLRESEFSKILESETYFDTSIAREVLGHKSGGVVPALRETVAACAKPTKVNKSH